MKKVLIVLLPLTMFFGCSVVRDVEVAKQDIDKTMFVVHNDIEPKLIELKAIVERVEAEYKKDREKTRVFWDKDVQPRLVQLEKITDSVKSVLDSKVHDAEQLWRKDMEPRIAGLEHLLASIEEKVEGRVKHALITWHKDFEKHLLHLESLSHASKEDPTVKGMYRKLKVDLRSIKVRMAGDGIGREAVKHVDALIAHVEALEISSAAILTKSKIAALRADIETEVSGVLGVL